MLQKANIIKSIINIDNDKIAQVDTLINLITLAINKNELSLFSHLQKATKKMPFFYMLF